MRALPALLTLVLTATACQSTTAAWTASPARLEEGIAACRAAKASAVERLQASHGTCVEDSDCVPHAQEWLGCAGWASVAAPPPRSLSHAVWDACMGLPSLAQSCDGNVGACVQGRCAGRASRGGDCDGAFAALLAWVQRPAACQADADCGRTWLEGAPRAVPARFEALASKELHAVADACPSEVVIQRMRSSGPARAPRCLEGTCGLVAAAAVEPLGTPRPRDLQCIHDRVGALLAGSDFHGRASLKFAVDQQGRTGAFSFVGLVPVGLHDPLMAGVAQCAWEPARRNGKPASGWVVLPLVVP